jgi:Uma2 family endonuclease
MSHVLDNAELRTQIFPLSVETYQCLIEDGVLDSAKVELIDGLLFEKMPKSKLHIHIVKVLFRILQSVIDLSKWEVQKEDPLQLTKSEPEPDLSIIQIPAKGQIPEKPKTAALVIEVAITSLMLDRAKCDEYAGANIPEYWIVCPKELKIEVYRHPGNGQYQSFQIYEASDTVKCAVFPDFSFCLADHLRFP